MERLTTETGSFICKGEHVCRSDDECYCDSIEKALKKLSEYENLEEQGLLIRLPCKVGDTIFVIAENYAKCGNHYNCEDYDFEQYLITWCEKYCQNGYQGTGVIQGTVSTIKITYDAIIVQIIVESGSLWKKIKDIFLTKEAAEAALKEKEK